jgi:hypothetical protein
VIHSSLPVRHISQKDGHALNRVLPAKRQQVLLRSGQTAKRKRQKFARHVGAGSLPQAAQTGRDDGFREEMMNGIGLKTECFAGEVKGADLPASVRQQPLDAHGAEFHLIEGAGGLALSVDFGPACVKMNVLARRCRGR